VVALRSALSSLASWGPWRSSGTAEPGAALFRGLHLRLTLWYSGVLVLALVACGFVLYFGLQDLTLSSARTSLRDRADFQVQEWLRTPPHICGQPTVGPGGRGGPDGPGGFPPPRRTMQLPVYVACFDPQGGLIRTFQPPGSMDTPPETFLDSPLVQTTLRDGTASDVIDGSEDVGPILRVAAAVRNPASGEMLGVVQVGQSVAPQWDTLQLVRALLLLLIVVATLGSIAGGLLLADRALEPARLAFARQQAFIADASHQLRTPLTLLRADAELLLRHRERLAEDDAALLEDIVAETAHMDRLATSLLSLARLDASRHHMEHDVVDLSTLAGDIAGRVATLAGDRGINVAESYGENAVVLADQQAVEQAALILVENALKYTPAGGTVTLRTETNDGHASLIVEDTGVGMPAEQLARLGERFYRGDPARSPGADGTGLGLAIAYRIATSHGGSLEFSSAPEQGTRATLSLPTSGPKRHG
jgi:signal transduction histidine kinase